MIPSVMEFRPFQHGKAGGHGQVRQDRPGEIDEYIADGGYAALAQALDHDARRRSSRSHRSRAAGSGRRRIPHGQKWDLAAAQAADEKCSSAMPTRATPEPTWTAPFWRATPTRCSKAWPSAPVPSAPRRGIVYVRAEYPLAVKIVSRAIDQARGRPPGRTTFWAAGSHLDIEIFQGSGAFVCGEETALIQSIEGFRGMPRHRPPYPVPQGLWGKPTVINNVKTLASVPPIIELTAPSGFGHRHGKQPRNGHFLGGGQCGSPRPGGDPHGRHPARADFRHLRRHPQQKGIQSGSDRRPLGRLPARVDFWTPPSISTPSPKPAP